MTDQRVLWVTGGGSGMGAASAEAAARDGWTVVLSGRRVDRLEQVDATITAAGGTAEVLPLDAADPAAVASARDAVLERFGRLDAVVLACAGQEEGRLKGTVARLVCLDETEDLGELVGVGGDRVDDLSGSGAHGFHIHSVFVERLPL